MTFHIKIFVLSFLWLSCGNKQAPQNATENLSQLNESSGGKNSLSMKINGTDWIADNNIFGAFHPKGYNKAIIISGSKGKKDKNEQPFNINLYNAEGPAIYHIKTGNKDLCVAQLANMSNENYLCGSMMGFDLQVKVIKASTGPDIVEATFSGEMNCANGEKFTITDGKFFYHE